jgi:hypothetical protein
MKTKLLLALAGLAAGLITAAFSQDEVTPEIRQQIEALNQKLDEAINNHDPAGCAACHIATGVVVTPVGTFVGQQEIVKCYAGVFQRFGTLSHEVDKIAHLYNFYSDLCGFTTFSNNLGGGVRSIIYTPEGDTWKIRVMVVKY